MSFFNSAAWTGDKSADPRLPQCGRCGLSKRCISPKMQPTGQGKRSILIVAEAPGKEEDAIGIQLVGKSGQLVRRVLAKLGTDLDHCHKTNAVICRPPDNQMDDKFIDCCRPNLLATIRDLRPRVIVLMGGASVKSLLALEVPGFSFRVSTWAGWTIPLHKRSAWVCPTYHPAYLLRSEDPVLERLFEDHLRSALALESRPLDGPTLEDLESRVEPITSARLARLRLRDLLRKSGRLAFDFETTGLKPDHPEHRIVSCGFCLEGEDTFALMLDDLYVHKLVARVMRKRSLRKVGANIKFEERWSRAKLGTPVAGWYWDGMVAAHVLDNRPGITSVKFQSFVRFGIPDYAAGVKPYLQSTDERGFNTIDRCPTSDLLTYNGLDAVLEFMIMEQQREAMGVANSIH